MLALCKLTKLVYSFSDPLIHFSGSLLLYLTPYLAHVIQKPVEVDISVGDLIRLSFSSADAKLLLGWGSPFVTLAVLPSATLTQSKSRLKPFEALRRLLEARIPVRNAQGQLPPFTTGLIGHLTYEAAALLEPSLTLPPALDTLSPICFSAYDASVSLHLPSGKTSVYATNDVAADRLMNWLKESLSKSPQTVVPSALSLSSTLHSLSSISYQDAVEAIRQRILAGDFFQANLTRMLSVELGNTSRSQLTGFAERLLNQSQAPFGSILNFENATVISASPERFFRIEPTAKGRKIFAEPIKGTRPRHADPELDEALKQDLLNSEKDRAENIMIADLVRNDLSRVCTDESILADPVCELKTFANVHHLVTRVSGILREEVSNLDALLAQFPCGSITGAPKWAAMDAIAELEQCGRGIYCGAIGYFDDRGHADFSVAIRTAVANFQESGTTLTYGTGGGITILSDPSEEFTETEDKAAGFLRALQP